MMPEPPELAGLPTGSGVHGALAHAQHIIRQVRPLNPDYILVRYVLSLHVLVNACSSCTLSCCQR
jgi:hypothetical protein